ncbi:MAG: nucleotide sugar dehydrogenase [Proteobacteria bacterium]|nr:nucleotide sugar dehydrogenase [Pseudomonadota bacterium]
MHVRQAGEYAEALSRRLRDHEATIGVIGLGYVGLPLALAFAQREFRVLGFDVDPQKVEALAQGRSYISHIDAALLRASADGGRLEATTDFGRLGEPDAILICVPTPLSAQREPDLSYVVKTSERIKQSLRPGQLVVLESTTYPGTTIELIKPLLESTGLHAGQDFFLAFSPEREDPGNTRHTTTTIPKVVGGVDPVSGQLAQLLYDQAIARTVRVSSADAAEATKLTENIFRAVNIALVNELKLIYAKMGIDIWEVLDAAETKPFGFMRFDPGPGWGGHCIPLDPFYLSWKAREHGLDTRFIELAGQINRGMPTYVVHCLQQALNDRGKALKGSDVLMLGMAYKKDVGDTRESPAFEVMRLLLERGARIAYHDPHVPVVPETRDWGFLPRLESQPLSRASLQGRDAVVLVTAHSGMDYELVQEHAALIVDARGVYRGQRPNVVKA